MKKSASLWTISELREKANSINFPEYQREPNIWSRNAKQRLIDSIARCFDIASFYFYVDKIDNIESWDCVDGRQRIGAILSFLSENSKDMDEGFEFQILNEIFDDEDHPFRELDGKTYEEISTMARDGDSKAQEFQNAFLGYHLTIVMLEDSARPEEFNLQFARLNLGTIINSGEKLNAMVGELRNLCFEDLGEHKFLEEVKIPTRRFAREQLAAQIVAQVFAFEGSRQKDSIQFARTRHVDLQRLFKEYTVLGENEKKWIDRLRDLMDLLAGEMESFPALRSRAIILSTVLLAYGEDLRSSEAAQSLGRFIGEFVNCLLWQIGKGLDIDREEYGYLIEFQRHLTQASVEKQAVTARDLELKNAYHYWLDHDETLPGDAEFKKAHLGKEPRILRKR